MKKNSSVFLLIGFLLVFVFSVFFGSTDGFSLNVFLELRVARVVLGAAVGGALAVSGVLLQALFSNPLCDPYTLGISSGATLGTVMVYSLGMSLAGIGPTGGALLGALGATSGLIYFSRALRLKTESVLLCGVMLSFLGASLVSLWMAFTDANGVQSALSWLMGDLSKATFHSSLIVFLLVGGLCIYAARFSRELDLFLLGEEDARSLGLSVNQARFTILAVSSLLVSFSVSTAGMIGFVGLVIPHFSRICVGVTHRKLIFFAAFLGAEFVMLSDVIARQLIRPYELPVGVVTSLVGAPVFVWFLLRQGVRRES